MGLILFLFNIAYLDLINWTSAPILNLLNNRSDILLFILSALLLISLLLIFGLMHQIKLKQSVKTKEINTEELQDEKMLNQFAISLYGRNTIDDILWNVARNCIKFLEFEDCVIYRADTERKVLLQIAAAGNKSPDENTRIIFNPIEIPFGKGITGTVAVTGKPEIIDDTSIDSRYVLDDLNRLSEITVPIFVDGKLWGILDSEHSQIGFYNKRHLELLQNIAYICSEKLTKLMVEESLRQKISRDLHDEMGSTLTSINILSSVALSQDCDKFIKEYLEKINHHSSDLMETMSDIVWAISPQHDSMDRLFLRMKEFAVELLEPVQIQYEFTGNYNNIQELSAEERKFLYLIYKEALNNAVKYSEAKKIKIVLQKSSEHLLMIIDDNGKGFDIEKAHNGNGLRNMKERAKAIQAEISIISSQQNGTQIKLDKNLSHHQGITETLN